MELSSNRETPIDINLLVSLVDNGQRRSPETEMQALMEAGVGQEPAPVSDAAKSIRMAVVDSIDLLSEQDRFLIEAVDYEQITFKQLGGRLGVSDVHAWRLYQAAKKNLTQLLLMNETIANYLGRDEVESWEAKMETDGKNSLTQRTLTKSKTN